VASIYGQTVGGLLSDAGQGVVNYIVNNPLESAAIATSTTPIVGDIVGLLADGKMYVTEPQSRTLANAGLTAAGIIPGIPAAALARQVDVAGAALSKNKYRKPIEEVQNTFVPTEGALMPKQTISPEAMQGGVGLPLLGDRTRAGGVLTEIDGNKLDEPDFVQNMGGMDYARSGAQKQDGAAWASDKSVVSRIQKTVDEQDNDNVFLVYSAMGGRSGDASNHMSDAIMAQIKATGLTKKTAKQFDAELRKQLKDWPGVLDDNATEYLQNLTQGERKKFVELAAQGRYVDAGFPDDMATRLAISEPVLVGEPTGMSGQMIAKAERGAGLLETPSFMHHTYPVAMKGEYMGGLLNAVPRQVMFPDFDKARRAADASPSLDHRAFAMNKVTQEFDQEWLDGVMNYIEQAEKAK